MERWQKYLQVLEKFGEDSTVGFSGRCPCVVQGMDGTFVHSGKEYLFRDQMAYSKTQYLIICENHVLIYRRHPIYFKEVKI